MHLFVFLTYRVRLNCPILTLAFIWSEARYVPNLESPRIHNGGLPKLHRFGRQRIHGGALPLSLGISPRRFEIVAHRPTDRIDKI